MTRTEEYLRKACEYTEQGRALISMVDAQIPFRAAELYVEMAKLAQRPATLTTDAFLQAIASLEAVVKGLVDENDELKARLGEEE
jgi:hypothetical protein